MRWLRLSPGRRLMADISWASLSVPRCIITARLHLPRALAAREACADRPPWPAIFAKAFGLLARERPVLRQMHVSLPWPSLVEVNSAAACILVERQHEGEAMLTGARIRDPGGESLAAIGARLAQSKTAADDRTTRRMLRFARLPWPLRRLALRLAMATALPLHRYAGSFVISALGGQGALILDTVSLMPVFLSFGPIGGDGAVDAVISFDHRVMDGAAAAAALRGMEALIETVLADEMAGGLA
ncbi:hypothetical protein EOD42_12280 [Rhodovarius crocodyli]|uniref:2-oxoacid dehydrogenase acyltransferase catalytic domain-containing protein n=1 Tax=Rhodovarius crocodyli TaxID=1979269 RepID=A0A437ME86_9PROT|nr:hypothetical protein [Rhodovarius crocodyli]RVT95909.1 hypothetical protein EOD42_12280 [Rhodovarius crocodyli]